MNNAISFMVRVHNEEATIERSIRSLDVITIPHEIIVILHKCNDGSFEIVKRLKDNGRNISIFEYDYSVSRAGYETLCTDATSKHSLPSYLNWCLSKCGMKWKFKWDADFVMTYELSKFLELNLHQFSNTAFRINAVNSTSSNGELYLTDSIIGYSKYIFWEVPNFSPSSEVRIENDKHIIHDSEIKHMKQYWKEKPWFYFEDTIESNDIRGRYEKLVSEFGEEPNGLARASNPECNDRLSKIINSKPDYINFYN
jgi:glycosyltransferase involved in cell wall biosynthesis